MHIQGDGDHPHVGASRQSWQSEVSLPSKKGGVSFITDSFWNAQQYAPFEEISEPNELGDWLRGGCGRHGGGRIGIEVLARLFHVV
jgi:hypothetical protein